MKTGFWSRIKSQKSNLKNLVMTLAVGGSMLLNGGLAFMAGASGNNVTVTGADNPGEFIYAGHSDTGDSSNNRLNVSDVHTYTHWINAGESSAETASTNNNTTTITDVTNVAYLHGGYAYYSRVGEANNNTVNVYGGHIYHIHGGHVYSGNANNNSVNFYDGTIDYLDGVNYSADSRPLIGAGYADEGNANENIVNIHNGNINGTVQGGYVYGNGNAIGNTVNIYGGAISGDVLGGYVGGSGEVRDNTINIYGNPDLSNAYLYAGKVGNAISSYSSNNTLNINSKNITAKNISGFDNLNFNMPSDTTNGDVLLTLTDTAPTLYSTSNDKIILAEVSNDNNSVGTDLSNTTVNLNAAGGSNINTGDTITLLKNDNGIATSNITNSGIISEGISLDYKLNLITTDTDITAVVGERMSDGLNDQTKALAHSNLVGPNILQRGTERLLTWLPPEEGQDDLGGDQQTVRPDYTTFANFSSGNDRVENNGNRLSTTSGGIDVGVARRIDRGNSKVYWAPLFDYGNGDFTSDLKDGPYGKGSSKYYTGGFIARNTFDNGFYYEGSFRMGTIKSNYASDNFMRNGEPVHVNYTSKANCWAGHINMGRRIHFGNSTLDMYGIYFQSHQGSSNVQLNTGETYRFGDIDDRRLRIGARLTMRPNPQNKYYSGIAYQWENGADSQATYLEKDLTTPEMGSSGSSVMLELGWQHKPSPNAPLMMDISAVGWAGHHKGFSVQAKIKHAL